MRRNQVYFILFVIFDLLLKFCTVQVSINELNNIEYSIYFLDYILISLEYFRQCLEVFYEPGTTFVRATHILFDNFITRRKIHKYYVLDELPCFVDYRLHPKIVFTCHETVSSHVC
jgi:hypothetical protein